MTVAVSPTESQTMQALGAFLTSVLATDVQVIQGQVNRVPEPSDRNFVVMWPLRRPRLSTNVGEKAADASFTASIAGTVMTVTAIASGTIAEDATLFGSGVTANTVVGAQLSGTAGGAGTYAVSPGQTLSSRAMAAGAWSVMQPTEVVVQLDVHGPLSGDNAQIISTLFRDPYGVEKFAESGFDVAPLYTDDPKQIPFTDGEKQYEDRWVVEAHMQANQTVVLPQQYADAIEADLINVDAVYPA